MIVRILGEGQFDVPDADRATIEELGDVLTAAVDGHDEGAFTSSLAALIDAVRPESVVRFGSASTFAVPF